MKKENVTNVYFTTYKVLPIGYKEGLIFYPSNRNPISRIIRENKTLKYYLNKLENIENERQKETKGSIYEKYLKTVGM